LRIRFRIGAVVFAYSGGRLAKVAISPYNSAEK
jgi:hypothetical protein